MWSLYSLCSLQALHAPAPVVDVPVGDELSLLGEPDLEMEQMGQEDVVPEVREEVLARQVGRVDEHLEQVARGEVGVRNPAGVALRGSGGAWSEATTLRRRMELRRERILASRGAAP